MAIILRLDRMMADRKISLNELSEKVGIANVNLSKIKTGKVSGSSWWALAGRAGQASSTALGRPNFPACWWRSPR